MGYSGAEGNRVHEKTWSRKSRDTVPLTFNLIFWSLSSHPRVPGRYLNRELPYRLQQACRHVNTSPYSRADSFKFTFMYTWTETQLRSGKLQNQRSLTFNLIFWSLSSHTRVPGRYLNRELPFRLQQACRRVNTSPYSRADSFTFTFMYTWTETQLRSGKLQNQRSLTFNLIFWSLSSHPRVPGRYLNRELPFRLQQACRRVNTSPHSRADSFTFTLVYTWTETLHRSGKLQNQRALPLI